MGKKRKVKGYEDSEVLYDTSIFDDPDAYQKFLEDLESKGELDMLPKTQDETKSYGAYDSYEDDDETGPVVTEETFQNIMHRMVSGKSEEKIDEARHKVRERREEKAAGGSGAEIKKEFNNTYGKQRKDNVVCPAIVGNRRIQVNGRKESILCIDPVGRSTVLPFYKEETVSLDNDALGSLITTFIEACQFTGYPDVVFMLDTQESDDLDEIGRLLKSDEGFVSGRKSLSDGTQLHILHSKIYPDLAFGYILEPLEWTQKVGQAIIDVMTEKASISTTLINGFAFLLDSNILMMDYRAAIYEQLLHYGEENEDAFNRFVKLWNSEKDTETNMIAAGGYYESHVSSIFEFFSELVAVDNQLNAEKEYGYEQDDRDLGGFDPYKMYQEGSTSRERTGGSGENGSFREGTDEASTNTVRKESGESVRERENIVPGNREADGNLREGSPHQPNKEIISQAKTEAERERFEAFRSGKITAAELLSQEFDEVVKEEKEKENNKEGSETVPQHGEISGEKPEETQKEVKTIKPTSNHTNDGDRLLIDPII